MAVGREGTLRPLPRPLPPRFPPLSSVRGTGAGCGGRGQGEVGGGGEGAGAPGLRHSPGPPGKPGGKHHAVMPFDVLGHTRATLDAKESPSRDGDPLNKLPTPKRWSRGRKAKVIFQ